MRKLIVAEKPSVARDIARVLGVHQRGDGCLLSDAYVVTWAIGHLVSLCEPDEIEERYKKWSMAYLPMLPEDIPLKVLPKTRSQFAVIKSWMHNADIASIICATDSAREGELIFRYIYQMAGCKKPVERLWISSMTDQAIRQGFSALRPDSDYDALYESARCRSEADWLVGMNASRAFSLCYNAHLSVGRVQTPTLSLIVKRDKEIAEFVPQDYWELKADFGDYSGLWMDPETKETRSNQKETLEAIRRQVAKQPARVAQSQCETKRMAPPQLFDLTSLQRDANRKYGFSADKTLKLAQALYETHKLVTYPRTDSRYLPDDMAPKIRSALRGMPQPYADFISAPEMDLNMHTRRFYDNEKISDHHAIVTTDKRPDLQSLSADEAKLYDMIVRRLIAAHYPAYEYESASLLTAAAGHTFKSTGSMPLREGWRALYRDEKPESKEPPLPRLSEGDMRTVEKTSISAHKTKPPLAHTDASILNMMENAGRDLEDETLREKMKSSGLGTPATRAAVIERLIAMGYAQRKGRNIVSTEKGRQLIAVTPEQISSAVTTGKWEKALSDMAALTDETQRKQKSQRFMDGIRRFSVFLVDAAKQGPRDIHFAQEYTGKRRAAKKQ